MIDPKFISAFIMGLFSSAHCFGMCGGISAAFGISTALQSPIQRLSRLFAYNAGRITCYVALGIVFGYFSEFLSEQFRALMLPLRVLAGVMLIAMACYLAQWWMGITVFERAGQKIWKQVQPFSLKLKPAQGLHQAYAFGLLWGLLPCGLVYSMLVWVSASGRMTTAALLMFGFGLGTLPAMVATGYGSARLQAVLQNRITRQASAILLLLYGLWTVFSAFGHGH